jgi:DNA polymerase elongation subunit (family B)
MFTDIKNEAEACGDKAMRTIAKLFLNSLYGKFASHYFLNSTKVVDGAELEELEEIYPMKSVMNVRDDLFVVCHNLKPKDDSKADQDTLSAAFSTHSESLTDKDLNIPLAATITSHARIMIYNLYMEIEEKMGGKMCYTDTDSVFA